MVRMWIQALPLALLLCSCGAETEGELAAGADTLLFAGARIDGSDDAQVDEAAEANPVEGALAVGGNGSKGDASAIEDDSAGPSAEIQAPGATLHKVDGDGRIQVKFAHLSLDELDDVQLEDLLDALLYPDEYEDSDRAFPPHIQALDNEEVAVEGYMIPVVWEDTEIVEFMLVRDLLACCFGGAPQPDEWVSVKMPAGQGSEYFSFVPIIVEGVFHISALEDEAGYAAGCYRMDGEVVRKSEF